MTTRTEYVNYMHSFVGYYGAGAGHAENDTPFNRWFYGHTVSGENWAWCEVFECYVENHFDILKLNGGKSAYVPNMPDIAKKCGAKVWKKPRHGSAAFKPGNKVGYDFNRSGEAEHTGTFWKGIDSTKFYSIDANTGNDQVAVRTRYYSDVLFVVETLGLDGSTTPTPKPEPKEVDMDQIFLPPRSVRFQTGLSFPKGLPKAVGLVYDNTYSDSEHPAVPPAQIRVAKHFAGKNDGKFETVVVGEPLDSGHGWAKKYVVRLDDAPKGEEYDYVSFTREDTGNRDVSVDWS